MPQQSAQPDDDLLDQWSFLDSMVERQAARLRSGVQDEEESALDAEPAPAAVTARAEAAERDLAALQMRVAGLDATVAELTASTAAREERIRALDEQHATVNRQLAEAVARAATLQSELAATTARLQAALLQMHTAQAAQAQQPLPAPPRRWWQR